MSDLHEAIALLRRSYTRVYAIGGSAGAHLLTNCNGHAASTPSIADAQILVVLPLMYGGMGLARGAAASTEWLDGGRYDPIESISSQTPPTCEPAAGLDPS
jgi:hypothetical protein